VNFKDLRFKFKTAEDRKQLYTGILGLSVIIILGVSLSIMIRTFGTDKIQEVIKSAGIWGPILFILFHIVTIMISPTGGGSILISVSGVLFGFWPGMFYSILSASLGASMNFWVAKVFGQKVTTHIISAKTLKKLDFIKNTINTVNPILLVPIFSSAAFNVLCYFAGLTNIKYSKFITAVFISSSINIPVYVAIGSSVLDNSSNLPKLVLPFVVLIALIAFVIEEIIRKKNKKIDDFNSMMK
jgi:uncharacterized membrane protein YdjX (TVP38/TMEM64 family)